MAAADTAGGERPAGDRAEPVRPGPGPRAAAPGGTAGSGCHGLAGRWWTPALLPGEPAGAEPDWAAFVRETVASAPEEAVVPEEEHPGLTGFVRLLAPLTAGAGDRLARDLPDEVRELVDVLAVRDGFERRLGRRLAALAARTLVLELHRAGAAGLLGGTDTRARFRDFLRRTGGRAGLAALLGGYPVLGRLLGRAAVDAVAALAEMLRRLAADRPALPGGPSGAGGRSPGRLVSVVAGAGDGHRDGRSVMLLRFADGSRLVYKPRPLAAHRHFNELVSWFGKLPGVPELRTPAVLDRGAYGWTEFMAARPCASAARVAVFYRRQGALLALLHVLDGTDLHHENLIACGEHPVLVDVETLFHPPFPPPPSATGPGDPAAAALHASVHRVGLLPQLLVGDDSALDMSAAGGGRAAVSPVARADWADAGTDRMRLVRRPGRFAESANRPRLDGRSVSPAAYTDALCEGFRAAYTALAGAREELLGPGGLLELFAGDEVRVVARPTWIYSTLLDESTHPDLLREAAARQEVFGALRTGELGAAGFPGLEDDETAQLWAGDVPLFTTRPGGTRLWGSGAGGLPGGSGLPARAEGDVPGLVGSGLPGLAESGLARAAAKVAALDTVDRQDQEWLIRAAMAGASPEPAHRPAGARRTRTADAAPEPERLLSAARSVGDRLLAGAYRNGGRTNWIGLELLGERWWRVGPMAGDLAGGYPGPALFLAQLAALTGAERYAEGAGAALAPVAGLLDALHERPADVTAVGSGAFAGLGGIAYALAGVARLLDDSRTAELAGPALRLAGAAALAEGEHGVRAGTAGGLAVLTAACRAEGRTEWWRAAGECADRLLAAGPAGEPGFAEGAAGIGWALLRYAAAAGSARHRDAGLAALRSAAGSPDLDRTGSWCRGRTGVALAIADSPAALADPELAAWARRTTAALCRGGPAPDDSLCHGEAGVLELLGHGALPEARPYWVRRAGALLAAAEEAGPRCGTPGGVPHPGLLTGLAGTGLGLLRAGFPDRVPSVLLLGPAGAPGPLTPAGTAPGPGGVSRTAPPPRPDPGAARLPAPVTGQAPP
ncbi:type 2 lanthipeptide synthetase LanM [Streptomyces sp. LP05-1]|uniref:Type 2 lanthipeptide synthetase LanM n=1 Tax=Streptomyces pyxinae TaxID=2970734 RepID=A0ABT2CH17_9ACTN|nr:type 2 lanthipeptide synthetase LanM [Streptomyces sp. LP05-1]MCS0636704.1 type 2 lanthipeptide synthetase LanM [Streptomyces sp. LP05-1]